MKNVAYRDIIWFYCNINRKEKGAKGRILGCQFLVDVRSKVQEIKTSLKRDEGAYELRHKLEKRGIITKGRFKIEYVFENPSVALKVIRGTSKGNLNEWTDSEGRTIKNSWNKVNDVFKVTKV